MALPAPLYDHLAASPLVTVICQLRFEEHSELSTGGFIKPFHRALGGLNGSYPRLERAVVSQVTLTEAGATSVDQHGWNLRSDDGWTVSVLPGHVALETTSYSTWSTFRSRLAALIEATSQHIDPAVEQRLGLRYVDQLRAPDYDALPAWQGSLRDELLGVALHPELGPRVRLSEQRLVLDLDNKVSCQLRHGTVPGEGVCSYVLDFDVYRETAAPFDADRTLEMVEHLHDNALILFQQTVTEAYWNQLRLGGIE